MDCICNQKVNLANPNVFPSSEFKTNPMLVPFLKPRNFANNPLPESDVRGKTRPNHTAHNIWQRNKHLVLDSHHLPTSLSSKNLKKVPHTVMSVVPA
jgi:hypothetical protein